MRRLARHQARVRRLAASLGALLSASAVVGCQSCEKDKPYTPFGVASGAAPSASAGSGVAPSASSAAPAPSFARRPALMVPGGSATRWTPGGRQVDAPPGRVFERGLGTDLDGDGKEDVVAWTLPAKDAKDQSPGELWVYPAQGEPRRVLALPGFVPSGPSCRHHPELTQSGPRTLTLDVSATCDAAYLPRTPARSITVVAPLSERPIVASFRLAAPAAGETATFEVDSTDRDDDGRDDVRLVITVGKDKAPRPAVGHLIWFDRAAGTARDATEPRASIARVADLELGRARRKAPDALAGVDNVRRWLATVCAEGGVPRVFGVEGDPLPCGDLQVTVDRLALAEVHAALAAGDKSGAVGVLTRESWYFGSISKQTRANAVAALEKAFDRVAATVKTTSTKPPSRQAMVPRWVPMAFDQRGDLLVVTDGGLRRLGADGSESDIGAEGGEASWGLPVTDSTGARWMGVVHSCDTNDLALALAGADGALASPVPTELLAARPGPCTPSSKAPPTALVPLAFKPGGVEALVAGAHVGPKTSFAEASMRLTPRGTPRSPDGRWLAVASPIGVVVLSATRAELWRGEGIDGATLSECTAANDAKRVACLDGAGAVRLLSR